MQPGWVALDDDDMAPAADGGDGSGLASRAQGLGRRPPRRKHRRHGVAGARRTPDQNDQGQAGDAEADHAKDRADPAATAGRCG